MFQVNDNATRRWRSPNVILLTVYDIRDVITVGNCLPSHLRVLKNLTNLVSWGFLGKDRCFMLHTFPHVGDANLSPHSWTSPYSSTPEVLEGLVHGWTLTVNGWSHFSLIRWIWWTIVFLLHPDSLAHTRTPPFIIMSSSTRNVTRTQLT